MALTLTSNKIITGLVLTYRMPFQLEVCCCERLFSLCLQLLLFHIKCLSNHISTKLATKLQQFCRRSGVKSAQSKRRETLTDLYINYLAYSVLIDCYSYSWQFVYTAVCTLLRSIFWPLPRAPTHYTITDPHTRLHFPTGYHIGCFSQSPFTCPWMLLQLFFHKAFLLHNQLLFRRIYISWYLLWKRYYLLMD